MINLRFWLLLGKTCTISCSLSVDRSRVLRRLMHHRSWVLFVHKCLEIHDGSVVGNLERIDAFMVM